ncbi:glycoside hydrolase family 3 protein [Actinorugispora endophytica]|uniref:Exo-1,4-beta-glucosidase n=1 Tax=Actinorugispora endophytica TaxID=1605990 RepID=A0A4R6UTU4_9ACTN|nr:glycoside hydrolase family 3 protein [Actinorugispora endophytica]TDQ50768.1 exo-1,4-beta-glucosidase [Actinorugispora endophytica]
MTEPFRDPALSTGERVRDLLARLTTEEKIGLLHQYQRPVERLGVGPFRTGTEALHGLAWLGPATVFPQAVGLASTWDPALVREVGAATAAEVLAFHAKDPDGAGRNVWAPVVNPLRDPRWGRNEEGYSEDPWLTGLLATAYARGLAGDDPDRLATAPTLKHFLAYNNETDRCTSSSNLPPRVLREYELPAFLPALREGAAVAVMPSYNLVNGRPAHLSPLIDSELRAAAPDDLLVVSDAMAPGNLVDPQKYHDDPAAAHAHAIRAGLDSFTQDDDRPEATLAHVRAALERGLIDEADLDAAVSHVLSVRTRLGEFDPGPAVAAPPADVVNCPAHQALARTAARRSLVLLKNDGTLPLRDPRRVAVIGQLGDTVMEDWYSGTLPYAVSARAGISERAETVFCEGVDRIALRTGEGYVTAGTRGAPLTLTPAPGFGPVAESAAFDLFDWGGACALRAVVDGRYVSETEDGLLANDQPGPNGWEVRQTFRRQERPGGAVVLQHVATGRYVTVGSGGSLTLTPDADGAAVFTVDVLRSGAAEAAAAAATAEVAVVVAGDHPLVNGRETEDRTDLELPAAQQDVLRAVRAANPATVLVLSSGCPFGVVWADENVPAILWSAHGGQEYGRALAEVLFGDADPAGRLTQTWYRSAAELPDLFDYDIIANDATYLYYLGSPLYPFGHGLSYTTMDYADPEARVEGDRVIVEATVTNTGDRAGEEVVQCYTHQRASRVKQPLRRLQGFARVALRPGERRRVRVEFPVSALAVWDVTRSRFVVEDAPRRAHLGGSARDLRVCAPLAVPGETIPPRAPARTGAADNDEYHGVVLCASARESGDAVRSTEAAAWAAFMDVDFTGPGPARAVLSVNAARAGSLTLRLDDPLTGPVAASVPVPAASGVFDFTEAGAPLAGVEGRRDLYVVFEEAGTALEWIDFA